MIKYLFAILAVHRLQAQTPSIFNQHELFDPLFNYTLPPLAQCVPPNAARERGRPAAITATAHKLAVIIWNMLTKKENYNYYNYEQYESKMRGLQIQNLNKKIRALGIQAHEINFTIN